MSMNLNASVGDKIGDKRIDLWQTPTYISYMCCVDDEGFIKGELKGKEAKRALNAYCCWVKEQLNGKWSDSESYEYMKKNIEGHVIEIRKHIKDKKLKVWVS